MPNVNPRVIMGKQLITLLFIITVLMVACNRSNEVFNQYKALNDARWHRDSIVKFTYKVLDTLSKNNLYINLRNNKDYGYSNLFLIVSIDFPSNTQIVDTLEYEMANAEGKFLGSGLTDIKENKLEYKENVVFPVSGEYDISIQQAMRRGGEVDGLEYLDGVTDVGLAIEKVTVNE